ncbi:MAG: 2-succinyl-5-enolpyruvyl-6-hydroxy-3-cyclohexene-1-carboxylic-acid synthase [Aquihabitans sp.]
MSPSDDRSPTPEPGEVTATFCATLVDEWVRAGVTDAVVAPGSRSTPMAMALAANRGLSVHVHHDERAAAFLALGLGLSSGRPAVVLTTSGTAAVELHPAVVEAHQAGVPLLVVTADRPPELHDVGAPQTVDQTHLFGRSVRWFAEPGPPVADTADTWRSLAARSVAESTHQPAGPGPVHLNLAFREPLVGLPGPLPAGRPDGSPWHTVGGNRIAVDRTGTERLSALLDVDRGVVVVGADCGDPGAVLAFAESVGWPVLADPRSGCRMPHRAVVSHADAILRHGPTAEALRPDAVLRVGTAPASKVLTGWLADCGAPQVAVDVYGRWFDADRTADHLLAADPTAVVNALTRLVGRPRTAAWTDRWERVEQAASKAIDAALASYGELVEPAVARTLVAALPAESTLMVSSSMPIRDVEWYGGSDGYTRILANRGANGIDGVVSTAVGAALDARGSDRHTAVLVGDVAFLHDTNALLGLAGRDVDLTIVIVDNDGGGIFSFLPQAEALVSERFEQLFGTPHGVDLAELAAAHGLTTIELGSVGELAAAVQTAVTEGGVRLFRVGTDRDANVAVHDHVHRVVADALDELA